MIRMKSRKGLVCALLVLVGWTTGMSWGYVPSTGGGDPSGFDPMESVFSGNKPSLKNPYKGEVSLSGGYGYSLSLDGVPALFPFQISLGYSSSLRQDRECAYGWSLMGMMELTRVRDGAYGDEVLYRLSGAANGLLRWEQGAGCYQLWSVGDGRVFGSETGGVWTIQSDRGMTWELEAQPAGSERFRVVECYDRNGNVVHFSYDGVGRLTRVGYGGNRNTGDQELAWYELAYEARDHAVFNAQWNVLEEWSDVLSEIKLFVNDGSVIGRLVKRLDLGIRYEGAVALYEEAVWYGYEEDGSELQGERVSFSYSGWDESSLTQEGSDFWDGVSGFSDVVAVHASMNGGQASESYQTGGLLDFNGDGLRDYVTADGLGGWSVRFHELNRSTGNHRISNTAVSFSGPASYLKSWLLGAELTTCEDIDGDGFPDLVKLNGNHFDVFYGNGVDFDGVVHEASPLSYVRYQATSGLGNGDSLVELMDVDGDGWKDLVRAEQNGSRALKVYYHGGSRGAGWDLNGVDVEAPWLGDLEDFGHPEKMTVSQSGYSVSQDSGNLIYETNSSGGVTVSYPFFADFKWVWGEFLDFNGDGWVDYVIAEPNAAYVGSRVGYVTVYFGMPGGGWNVAEQVAGHVPYWSLRYQGSSTSPMETLAGMYDVNGDGLVDFVEGGYWYKNEGDRITEQHRLPSWWTQSGSRGLTVSDVAVAPGSSYAWHATHTEVADINQDGVTDLMEGGNVLEYGSYPRPYLLERVEHQRGFEECVAYRPASEIEPRGSTAAQSFHRVMDLVDEVNGIDLIGQHQVRRTYSYADGEEEGGVFKGFGDRGWTEESYTTIDGRRTYNRLVVEEDYDLSSAIDYGACVKTDERWYTDMNRRYAPGLDTGTATLGDAIQYAQEMEYSAHDNHYLCDRMRFLTYGENGGYAGSPEILEVNLGYNASSKLSWMKADGGDGFHYDENDKYYEYNYLTDSQGLLMRLESKLSYGWDHLNHAWRKHNETHYEYDNLSGRLVDGQLTRVVYAAGDYYQYPDITYKNIKMRFERGSRGEIEAIYRSQGGGSEQCIGSNQWAYGGAVLQAGYDTLGRIVEQNDIDGLGRITRTRNANGIGKSQTYDGLGRIREEKIISTNGIETLIKSSEYQSIQAPYHTISRSYLENGQLDQTGYQYVNGIGGLYQTRKPTYNANAWITQDHDTDLYGQTRWTSHPYRGGTPGQHHAQPDYFAVSYYDSLGRVREYYKDYDNLIGSALVYEDHPFEEELIDEEGFRKVIRHDVYGRIVDVACGDDTVGSYKYDVNNQIVVYIDANGNKTHYQYDAVGRLKQSSSPDIGTNTFHYSYNNVTRKVDGAGQWMEIQYDLLDRPTNQIISHSLLGSTTNTYIYDQQLIGQKSSEMDDLGSTTYSYDPYGRLAREMRAYSWGNLQTNIWFDYTYDLQGRLLAKICPSGLQISNQWIRGYLRQQAVGKNRMSYAYNDYGQLIQTSNNLGMVWTQTRNTTPLQLEHLHLTTRNAQMGRRYGWYENGLLESKTLTQGNSIILAGAEQYHYDDALRLAQTKRYELNQGFKVYENFQYDNNGNLLSYQDTTGSNTTYILNPGKNQPAQKNQGTRTQLNTYDGAGRLAQTQGIQNRTYHYNGAGRIVQIETNGLVERKIYYAANGDVIAEENGVGQKTLYYKTWRYDLGHKVESENYGLGAVENGTNRWFYKDYDGTVLASFDDQGRALGANRYTAYGKRIVDIGSSWEQNAHHGGEYEENIGLYHLGVRHMDPESGHWLQPEPLLINGNIQDKLQDPLQLNPYRYARNNPMSLSDLTGMEPASCSEWSMYDTVGLLGDAAGFVPVLGEIPDVFTIGVTAVQTGDRQSQGCDVNWIDYASIGGDIIGTIPVPVVSDALGAVVKWVPKEARYTGVTKLVLGLSNAESKSPWMDLYSMLLNQYPREVYTIMSWAKKINFQGDFEGSISAAFEGVDEIHFALDGIDLNAISHVEWVDGNMTVSELLTILNDPKLTEKTTFYMYGEVVPQEDIIDAISDLGLIKSAATSP